MSSLDPLLLRQLRKAGQADPSSPPSQEVWEKLLKRISDHYRHMKEDRDMLVRSLELSTQEMEGSSPQRTNEQRSILTEMVKSLAESLGELATTSDVSASDDEEPRSSAHRIEGTETAMLARLDATERSLGTDTPEVALVRRNFKSLAHVLRRGIEERAQHRALQRELEVASSVQRLLLPSQREFVRPFLEVAASSTPADACSGDWWTVHDLPDGRVLVVVGDVTGHGVPAAILTGAAKASCDIARFLYEDKVNAGSMLRVMNRGIEGAGGQRLLMTCLVVIFDPHQRQALLANAGHPLPYLVRRNGERAQAKQIRVHGTPLGTTREATYNPVQVTLQDGDLLFISTDGLLECEGPGGDQFGHKRLRQILEESHRFEPGALRDVILHHLDRHSAGAARGDDVTFVACRFGET